MPSEIEKLELCTDLARAYSTTVIRNLISANCGKVEMSLTTEMVVFILLLALEDFYNVERRQSIEVLNQLTLNVEARLARYTAEHGPHSPAKPTADAIMARILRKKQGGGE